MLNISKTSINHRIDKQKFSALQQVESLQSTRVLPRLIGLFFLLVFVAIFLPWTQNIRAKGYVSTIKPNQRPQAIHATIGGKIENWFVQEGQMVEKGDTILFISEVKEDYLDPDLLGRTAQQRDAKVLGVRSYEEKVIAINNQIQALIETRQLKLEQGEIKLQQTQLKLTSDSMEYQTALINLEIADQQYTRASQLFEQGLKSQTETEDRQNKLQKAQAEKIDKESKLLSSRRDLINARLQLTTIEAEYQDKISKAKSDKFATLSSQYESEAAVAKLDNQWANYDIRNGMYYITAPQTGYITKLIYTGIGEIIKAGEPILTIMPADYELAVEMYIAPIDLPLLSVGQEVRIEFDGWPAIVFSGWPNASYGVYSGKIYAFDQYTSPNGMYRVLVSPSPDMPEWPTALRVGAGTKNLILLKDVPIWYEIWRKINGFPPDFYGESGVAKKDKSTKK